jgi:Cof subfamily protein (haloacid dehalogenase superfamily)
MMKVVTLKNPPLNFKDCGIRLVAIDLDGTLLDSSKQLPAGAAEIFKEARRAGLHISIVTGRNACSVRALGKVLSFTGPHASSGGALVSGNGGRPVYTRHPLSMEDARRIVEVCRRWNLTLFFQNDRRILMENGDRYLTEVTRPYYPCFPQASEDILATMHFKPLKATIYGEPKSLEGARFDFENCGGCFHATTAGEEDIEITSSGINKGSALREISAITGIPLNNIMAIGDSPNDLSMFQVAGVAVAVANALPGVQKAAKVVAPSNDEGGALWAIKNLALSDARVRSSRRAEHTHPKYD